MIPTFYFTIYLIKLYLFSLSIFFGDAYLHTSPKQWTLHLSCLSDKSSIYWADTKLRFRCFDAIGNTYSRDADRTRTCVVWTESLFSLGGTKNPPPTWAYSIKKWRRWGYLTICLNYKQYQKLEQEPYISYLELNLPKHFKSHRVVIITDIYDNLTASVRLNKQAV